MEQTLDYYPLPCELDKIVKLTIAACDPLDGRTDGVMSRMGLCKLNFNLNSTISESYYCASNSTSLGLGFGQKRKRQAVDSSTNYEPAQNGTVSAEGVVAQSIYGGLINSKDASTLYDSTTDLWGLDIASTGGEFVVKFIELLDADNLSSLDNVTYDTLVDWMNTAMVRYMNSLQTTLPDLTSFQSSGGKVLHYHGESDNTIPTGSSVHYYDSARSIMYPDMSYNESVAPLETGINFSLFPEQPIAEPTPFSLAYMSRILWRLLLTGVVLTTLNATVSSGTYSGETQQLCPWPLRPYWPNNGTTMECQYDQDSIDSWTYTFDAFKVPVY